MSDLTYDGLTYDQEVDLWYRNEGPGCDADPPDDGEEARRCTTCESLDHVECDEEITRMDDPEPENEVPDFRFEDHGTIWLVHSLTEGAYEHLSENVQADAQWIGNALAVEHRYARPLASALEGEGYIVGGDA